MSAFFLRVERDDCPFMADPCRWTTRFEMCHLMPERTLIHCGTAFSFQHGHLRNYEAKCVDPRILTHPWKE
jgi:hypothetical protein